MATTMEEIVKASAALPKAMADWADPWRYGPAQPVEKEFEEVNI